MRWLPPNGDTQGTSDGRYVIVKSSSGEWIAYDITMATSAQEIGTRPNESDARALCEAADRALMATFRKRA